MSIPRGATGRRRNRVAETTREKRTAPRFADSEPKPGWVEPWLIAIGALLALVLLLHGRVLTWPFLSDDFVFLSASQSLGQLFRSFDQFPNYFRPVGRELYFLTGHALAGNRPLPFHLVNLGLFAAILVLVVGLGARLGGWRTAVLAGTAYALLYPHRVLLGWVSCSQDLIATLGALLAVHALESGRRLRAALYFLVALLAKESVIALPLVWFAWQLTAPTAPSPGTSRSRAAALASLPLWLASAAWLLVVLVARALRHAWMPGAGTGVADLSWAPASIAEGLRSSVLALFALEQPGDALRAALLDSGFPFVTLGLAAALLAALVLWSTRLPEASRPVRDRAFMLGLLWAALGVLPLALAGHHFSAYYVTFAGVGFALAAGRMLAAAPMPLAAAALIAQCALGLTANRVDLTNRTEAEPVLGVSYVTAARLDHERVFLDSLRVALARTAPPRGATVYLTHAPHSTAFVTAEYRAPRLWFDDPALALRNIGDYRPGSAPVPHAFLRFDERSRGFYPVPVAVMDADLAAEAAMNAGQPATARLQVEHALAVLPAGAAPTVRLELLNNRGIACAALGDSASARASWREALALDPTFESAALDLARFDAAAGRLTDARDTLRRFLDHTPEAAESLRLLARVERALGDAAAAEAALRRLAQLTTPGSAAPGGS